MANNHLVKININNIEILSKKNTTIIQACLNSNLDIDIPRFCFHEKLSIAGNCRMCLVEVLKSPKPVVACAMQVVDGMVINTDTVLVKKAREGVLEFLLANHPLDCPICDQGGECDLQDQSMIFGGDIGRFYEFKRSVEDKDCGTLVKTVMTRCIHCTRCVRFLNEVAGIRTLGLVGRGNKIEIGTYLEKVLNTELSGNIIDLCPVGALTSKPYAFSARSWELISKESVDFIDSLGSDVKVDLRGTEVMRILPRLNEQVNSNWISDISRFYYDSIIKQRLTIPYIKTNNNSFVKSNWNDILNNLWYFYFINKYILKRNINFNSLHGELSDVQSLILLKEFNSFFNNYNQLSQTNDLRKNYLLKFNKSILLKSDIIVLVGLNLRLESPLYNVRLKKLNLKKNSLIVSFGSSINLNYSIKNLGLGTKSFLKFIEGKHYFCNLFLRSNSPTILLGGNINERSDSHSILNLLSYLKNNYKNNLNYGIINKDIGKITSSEINSSLFEVNEYKEHNIINNIYNSTINFKYLLNKYNYSNLNKNEFIVFQGHHWEPSLGNSDILLPSMVSLEKDSNFISLEGYNRKVNAVLPTEKNIKEDWKIILAIFSKYNLMLSKNKVLNLNKFYKLALFNLFKKNNTSYEFNIIIVLLELLLLKKININKFIKFNNELFLSKYINNYLISYTNDSLFNVNYNDIKNITPILGSKLYNNINNFDIVCLNNTNKYKLFNTNFNSCVESIYTNNILTKSSNILSSTHNRLKLFYTNYV